MTSTATENVFILDENFHLPHLDRNRRLWAYLPKGYNESEERYPVVYMQDGQNLFDSLNAFGNEWGIDETLDQNNGKIIVIGIDNGEEHRMAEYMLHDNEEHGPAQGIAYITDIAEAIKPFIDQLLRTVPDREHTYIAGSSMGGLISFYGALYRPDVFGIAGIFSPAFWVDAPGIYDEAMNIANQNPMPQRWYFYAGAQESETMVNDVAAMVSIFKKVDHFDTTYQIDSNGIHDENTWKNYFPFFYEWIMGHISTKKVEKASDIKVVND